MPRLQPQLFDFRPVFFLLSLLEWNGRGSGQAQGKAHGAARTEAEVAVEGRGNHAKQ